MLFEDMLEDVVGFCSHHLGQVLCGADGDKFVTTEAVERHLQQIYGRQQHYLDALRKVGEVFVGLPLFQFPCRLWKW
jgi:hypothetical protein